VTEWFERWFGEEYVRLYPHRDDQEAAQAVALIDRMVTVDGRHVLDLACGPGRHAAHLSQRGARVVGCDLSMPLLTRARARVGDRASFVRGDMRALPFASGSFDLVVNLFTSFGYFADDAQHAAVLRDVATLLKPQGTFMLDFLNASRVRATLVPREQQELGEHHVRIERRISEDDRFVIKEMHLLEDGRCFVERVRLFSPDDLVTLLESVGLSVRERFGGYDGAPLTDDAPRVLLCAVRG